MQYFLWLVSRLLCTDSMSSKAFSLDVILLINLYKNTANCAGDLVRMVAHASHDSHTKGHF